jgi:hypothetical protein
VERVQDRQAGRELNRLRVEGMLRDDVLAVFPDRVEKPGERIPERGQCRGRLSAWLDERPLHVGRR